MSDPFGKDGVPQPVLVGAALLLAFVVGSVAVVRVAGVEAAPSQEAALASRDLRFDDRADGSIAVRDARTAAGIETLPPGEGGFVRGAMRGLARDRKRAGIGPEIPFRLSRLADGRLILTDLATAQTIDLEAFGSTNAAAFDKLLGPEGRTP